jgi:aspartate-semialdehyde dehydrogenase
MIDNVVPFIRTEEEKMAEESRKILGGFEQGKGFVDADFVLSAHCNRVPVRDGHTETASVRLGKAATPAEVIEIFESFRGVPQEMGLPSAPPQPIVVRYEENRPQPQLDRDTSRGMVSVVGRVRECPVMGIKYVLLGHNTVRGAAGASILNAELFREKGLLSV